MQSDNVIEPDLRFRFFMESKYVTRGHHLFLSSAIYTFFIKGLDALCKKAYFDDLLRKSRVIDRFHSTIAPVTLGGSSESNGQLLVVHTYIRLATIRLGMFDSWKGKRFESALAVANMLDDVDVSTIGYMHPVVGVSEYPPTQDTLIYYFSLETFHSCSPRAFGRGKDHHRCRVRGGSLQGTGLSRIRSHDLRNQLSVYR